MGVITEQTIIEPDFVCSEKHRAFFKEKIGNSFSFPVAFQKWLKTNSGKTYAQAIEAYNTYIRDFFEANPGKTLQQAIACWKYKKALPGHNRYEDADLTAVKDL